MSDDDIDRAIREGFVRDFPNEPRSGVHITHHERSAYQTGLAQNAKDAERLDWLLPLLMDGAEVPEADARTLALGRALIKGLSGRTAIDAAIAETEKDTP